MGDNGNRRASRVTWILERFDRALITILISNSIAGIAGSVVTTVLFVRWFGETGTIYAVVIMTLLIFLFGDSIPKNIARVNSDAVVLAFSMPMKLLMHLLMPVEYIFIGISELVKLMIGAKKVPTMTEDEFSSFIETAEEEGVIEPEEGSIILSAITFADKTVGEIMQKVDAITAIEKGVKSVDIRQILIEVPYSRIPVYEKNIDNIIGIIQTSTFFKSLIRDKPFRVLPNVLPTLFMDPETHLDKAFEMMSRERSHLAIVRSGGVTLGVISLEDILEEIVGDIFDEFDQVGPLTTVSGDEVEHE